MQLAAEWFDDVCPQVATPRSAGRDAGSISGIARLSVAYLQFRHARSCEGAFGAASLRLCMYRPVRMGDEKQRVMPHVCVIMYVHSMFLFLMWQSSRAHRIGSFAVAGVCTHEH